MGFSIIKHVFWYILHLWKPLRCAVVKTCAKYMQPGQPGQQSHHRKLCPTLGAHMAGSVGVRSMAVPSNKGFMTENPLKKIDDFLGVPPWLRKPKNMYNDNSHNLHGFMNLLLGMLPNQLRILDFTDFTHGPRTFQKLPIFSMKSKAVNCGHPNWSLVLGISVL